MRLSCTKRALLEFLLFGDLTWPIAPRLALLKELLLRMILRPGQGGNGPVISITLVAASDRSQTR